MFKKLLSTVLLSCSAMALMAQLPVSTNPENKNVVLEEYTGIYCQYCPDGHRIANDLASNNPGDVVLINIHTGSFAAPNPGDPDFRTQWGNALVGQTNILGYPAGTINRHEFSGMSQNSSGGTAMSRSDWGTAANQVLSQSSYVNVALEGDLDLGTNTLTVDVEMYFTGSSAPSSVNLNVAILQDNIAGPQVDGGNYNPSQWLPSGLYNHQHMLRDLLTGQWGDVINNTSMGSMVQKQYVYNLPADINGVAMEPGDLEIVAFVAEGQQEVVTGSKGVINYITPPGVSITDLEIEALSLPFNDHCTNSFTPEVKVTNNASTAVDSFEVLYSVNGGAATSHFVTSSLAAGASTNITFPQSATLVSGENQISYGVSVDNVYKYVDLSSSNNTAGDVAYTLDPNPFAENHHEGFESSQVGEREPPMTVAVNPDDIDAYVVDESVAGSLPDPLAAGGTKSFRWRLNTIPAGQSSSLMWQKLDFSQSGDHEMVFHYAYGQISAGDNDMLEVMVSTDCGDTWTTVWSDQGSSMATTSPNSSSYYYPQPADWVRVPIDLSSYDGEPEVVVAIKGTSDQGNTLYIDQVEFNDENNIGVEELSLADSGLEIFPNPASQSTTLELTLDARSNVAISISDASGKLVKNLGETVRDAGSFSQNIDLDGLKPGIYLLNVSVNNQTTTQRLNVVKN